MFAVLFLMVAYSLGAYNFAQRIFDFGEHSLHFGLQSDLHYGRPQSRSTAFGCWKARIALPPTIWGLKCRKTTISSNRIWILRSFYWTGASNQGIAVWEQSRANDFGALIPWDLTVWKFKAWEFTISNRRFRILGDVGGDSWHARVQYGSLYFGTVQVGTPIRDLGTLFCTAGLTVQIARTYDLTPQILHLRERSFKTLTIWGHTISSHRFWIMGNIRCTTVYSLGHASWRQSRATDFGKTFFV